LTVGVGVRLAQGVYQLAAVSAAIAAEQMSAIEDLGVEFASGSELAASLAAELQWFHGLFSRFADRLHACRVCLVEESWRYAVSIAALL
jgi:hypothetical protein